MENLFLIATREKFRFPSNKGALTLEQVFDLPLTSAKGDSLDSVARAVNSQLKDHNEESFVVAASSPEKRRLQRKLDVLREVIAIRQAENEAARLAASRAAERAFLRDLIERKQTDQMASLPLEDLQARLKALEEG